LIQRTEVLKSNSKLYFSQLAIHLSKNRRRSAAAKMLYASFAFSCQQLFSKFFQEALRHPALPCPAGLSWSRCASARFRVMPNSHRSVKHFLRKFLKYFNILF